MTEQLINNHLKELRDSDYEMVKGEPDIRKWSVFIDQDQEIGRVSELLFDDKSRRIRYLVLDLFGKPLNLLPRLVIIPVGLATLKTSEKVVLFPQMTVGHLASLPSYQKGRVSIETERSIRSVFAPSTGLSYVDNDSNDPERFYQHEHFREDKNYSPHIEKNQELSASKEIKQNIERMKESIGKMEAEVEKLGKKED
jgi:hypothetical protein